MRRLISNLIRWIVLPALILCSMALVAPVTKAAQFENSQPTRFFTGLPKQSSLTCTLRGNPSRATGRIDLSWSCRSLSGDGSFLIEQSANGKTWQAVSSCRQVLDQATSYSCSLSRLTSGRTYQYRLCLVASSSITQCGTSNRTSAISVKAP